MYLPDFLNGDWLPEEFLDDVEPPLKIREELSIVDKGVKQAKVAATLGPWLITHREAVTRPLIEGVVNIVKHTPYTNHVGTLGFCWGGRYSILMAHGLVDAAVAVHPSLVDVPGDFNPVTTPTLLAVGDQDSLLPPSSVEQIQNVFKEKTDVATEVKIYEDQVHGFALRGDWSHEKDKKAMDDVTQQGIDWFNKHMA